MKITDVKIFRMSAESHKSDTNNWRLATFGNIKVCVSINICCDVCYTRNAI